MSRGVLLVRAFHGLLSAFFLACIGYVYYAAATGSRSFLAVAAVAALLTEGVIVLANRGRCPLGRLHRRLGDEMDFFQLFLPRRAAALAVPVLGGVAMTGIFLLLLT